MDRTSDTGIERIRGLEEQLAAVRVNSARHRQLAKAIRVEADLYRKALDAEQAAQRFDR